MGTDSQNTERGPGQGINTSETQSRVAVVVDSAASLSLEHIHQHGIQVAPMVLMLGDRSYLDGRDLTPTEFYRLLKDSSSLPSTSSPAPAEFVAAYRRAAEHAESAVCLTVASRFSSSYDSATTAVREAEKAGLDFEVRVIDTESAAGAQGLIAIEASRAAARGAGLEEVVTVVRDLMPKVRLLAFVDTLFYLWKGGRVSKIAHAGTSLLSIKPMFELSGGDISTIARPRTRRRAINKLVELTRQGVGDRPLHVTVMHADSESDAEDLRRRIESEFTCKELFVGEFTPVMGAHIGPGLLGIAYWSE